MNSTYGDLSTLMHDGVSYQENHRIGKHSSESESDRDIRETFFRDKRNDRAEVRHQL